MCKVTDPTLSQRKTPKNGTGTNAVDEKSGRKMRLTPQEAVDLPFTISDIRSAIPKECFKKDLTRSMGYFFRDWAVVAALLYFKSTVFSYGLLAKFAWWNVLGFYGWCLFVVGHDCGHGTFSEDWLINGIIGHICHAPLLVPFYGWAKSHQQHHQHHNHIDNDHSWRPFRKQEFDESNIVTKFVRFTPLLLFLYPLYLIRESTEVGFSGNHFNPFSPLFRPEERAKAAVSSLSVVTFLSALLYYYAGNYMEMVNTYVVPYFIFVAWLDLVTFMQHTDEKVYYFSGEKWNYLRGAMSTIDRTYKHLIDPFNLGYGTLIDHLHHNISDGHVVHHIFFTKIPHYNLIKATEAIKPILGKYYMWDETPLPIAFMKSLKCAYVHDDVDQGVYQSS